MKEPKFNPFLRISERVLLWTDVEPDPDRLYKMIFYDILKPRQATVSNNDSYIVFLAESLEDYEHLDILKGDKFDINLPFKSFDVALRKYKDRKFNHHLKASRKTDKFEAVLHFSRHNKTIMKIYYAKIKKSGDIFD